MSLSALLSTVYNFLINEVVAGYYDLHFRRTSPHPKLRPLPPHISRHFISSQGSTKDHPSPDYQLELLVCSPHQPDPNAHPVLFQHGVFGHASVWLEWMTCLHAHNYGGTTYALSLRGHGASWLPSSWFGMVWGVTHQDMCNDLLAGIDAVCASESGRRPILVGHSAGGELIQSVLSRSLTTTPARALIGTIPHFGADPVFDNWAKMDPLVNLRLMLHGLHPKSNISTPELMRKAYFGLDTKLEDVKEFGKWAPDYEAMRWPFVTLGRKDGSGMLRRMEAADIVANITDEGGRRGSGDKMLVLNGKADVLVQGTGERVVAEYRSAFVKSNGAGKGGVAFVEIDRAGHHVQNDVQSEEGAQALLGWMRQV
jgi:pimeloyl-ACP methyl ester carboxylesterase